MLKPYFVIVVAAEFFLFKAIALAAVKGSWCALLLTPESDPSLRSDLMMPSRQMKHRVRLLGIDVRIKSRRSSIRTSFGARSRSCSVCLRSYYP